MRDPAIDHDIAAMGELERVIRALLHEEDGQPVIGVERADCREDLLDDQRGEAERRLVEQEQLRAAHQRPCDRQHLLLASRQRAAALMLARLEQGKQRVDAFEVLGEMGGSSATMAPICRFSSTVMREKMRRPSGDCTMPSRATSCVGRAVMSRPWNRIRPSLRAGGRKSSSSAWSCRRRCRRSGRRSRPV